MLTVYDMASRRTPKRYPGHVLRKLRAERGVGRPPAFEHMGDTLPYAAAPLRSEEVPKMKNPKPIARLARRRGVRLTDLQAECLAHIERFGDARGYAPATVRSLEDRGLISPKTGKLLKKAREILAAVAYNI